MVPYPTSLEDAPAVVIEWFRTKQFKPETLHAVYHIVGFGLGVSGGPTGWVAPSMAPGPVLSEEELVLKLEQLQSLTSAPSGAAALPGAFDWKLLIATLLSEVVKILLGAT